ncbi:MAG TPA: chemotaxis protein CheA [Burkholderiales bacterium]|jgi:two-component system chemotaxis sensor kinase CheA|nr:chemotaxis protein CheA [Burkholderiales bacterium]
MNALTDMQDLLQDFLTEGGELLDDVDQKLVELEHNVQDKGLLNTIFRGFHTIKGGAGFLDAPAMVELCHRTENLFDQFRSDKLSLTPEMLDVILAATGEVKRMMGEMSGFTSPQPAPAELLEALDTCLKGEAPVRKKPAAAATVAAVPAAVAQAPANGEFDWGGLYHVLTGKTEDAEGKPVLLVAPAALPQRAEEHAPVVRAPRPGAGGPPSGGNVGKDGTMRVDTTRFDQILNLSGEIGLTKNRLNCLRTDMVRGAQGGDTLKTLDTVLGQLDMLVSDLQSAVMKARMQPVGRVFQKYSRLARDVARTLGKDCELIIEGADTEVDKTILEELNDPLVHLVRNSVDHGLETPADREAVGKPARGTIRLAARQAGDHIIIEITDDGRGMRADVLRQKAVEKGLISAEEANTLDERGSLNLIFLPGFSTKSEISEVSGRGVGMDVVLTNIRRLKGRIDLSSKVGEGSKVTISLPLTLAILPVLMMKQGGQTFAMPLTAVREIISILPENLQHVSGQPTLVVRGEALPVMQLSDLLDRPQTGESLVGVVATSGDKAYVLAVDSFVGQDEVMIKPLEGIKPKGVTGATLSGEGVVVLVLEMHEMLQGRV